MEMPKHEVRILFYDVKPEVVRKQTESYAEAFAKHEVLHRTEVDKWKEALFMAANLSGWDLKDMTNGYESKFIDCISKDIRKALCDGPLHVGENLVGIDARVNRLNLMRFLGLSKVNMIGICGISGIGKTTLAKAIYNSMYAYFEGSCFCEDVAKRHGLTQVQTQLINKIMKSEDVKISSISEGVEEIKKRVAHEPILLVLDDVDHHDQLEALAGSCHWFCPGSLIIFTSKDKQLLRSHRVYEIYETEFLDDREDIMLFCLYAFGQTHPTHDFNELTHQVVKYLQGHPLALKVVGNAMFEKSARVWRSQLDRLQMYPNSKIQEKLRPSFDWLDFDQKRIFLDIAFSLVGENKDLSASVLDDIDCFPDANIDVLVDKSLITISPHNFSLQMHELIRSMAREVVREESDRPIRLWGPSSVYALLGENSVTVTTKAVEVLVLLLEISTKKVHIDCKAFSKMKKLRILKVCYPELEDLGASFELKDFNVNFSGSLDFLSNELRLIYWHGYPFKFLPSDFYPENVVAIDLSYSNIKSFWTTPKCFKRLKAMKLSHCRNLTTTPNFTEMTNLKELILEGCVNLVKLHPSIGMLKKLVMLNMRDCIKIRSFPSKVEMDSLQVLNLSGCLKMDKLTEILGTLKTLVKLYVVETTITGFPTFISSLTNLQVLAIGRYQQTESSTRGASIFQKPPPSLVLPILRLLTNLSIRNCNISEVCPGIGALSCLERLDLSGNNFTNLPGGLSQLFRLRSLYLNSCKKLEVLPELPPSLWCVHASGCTSLQEPPRLIHQRPSLKCHFTDCPKMFGKFTSIDSGQVSTTTSHASTNRISLLLEYLCIQSKISEFFGGNQGLIINIHGDSIPEWFTNKSMGGHVKVELPPSWCYSKFKGYGVCVVFKIKESYSRKTQLGRPRYSVNNSDGASIDGSLAPSGFVDMLRIHDTDMRILLVFRPRNPGWKEAKNFVTFTFTFGCNNEDYEVMGCGARLVCDEEDGDLQKQQETEVLSMIKHLPPQTQRTGFLGFGDFDDETHFYW